MRMTLAVYPQLFTIHSFSSDTQVPAEVLSQPLFFIAKTREELSVVVDCKLELDSLEQEEDWRCLELLGPLGFSMTGIMARVSATLADAHVSIFTVSTFDTDYILLTKDKLDTAIRALRKQQYQVIEYGN
ncbi:ACT domain-containing protein [Shewanella indica]|uniref:ACT domain-containing protein n=1 Tax=Shewanella indica TaxID=768528 RepID=UPI000C34D0D0|nr:ACT domain-containing protein [Shewanella indica]GHB14269.1 amino acid-binding protein [Shewanella indica]